MANNQQSMLTELMLEMYTNAVVENKRGCAAMCHAVSKPDKIFQIAALKAGFKHFKLSSEMFRYLSDHCYKLPHFKWTVQECPELEPATV